MPSWMTPQPSLAQCFRKGMPVFACGIDSTPSSPTNSSPVSILKSGQPAECPWRLALATLLQFSENLSDRRAADAVRSRIDWKYLLGLPLSDPGFDASVLSEFRSRLVKGKAETLLFDRLLALGREQGFLTQHGRQRTDSTHVLGAVRALNRLGLSTPV